MDDADLGGADRDGADDEREGAASGEEAGRDRNANAERGGATGAPTTPFESHREVLVEDAAATAEIYHGAGRKVLEPHLADAVALTDSGYPAIEVTVPASEFERLEWRVRETGSTGPKRRDAPWRTSGGRAESG